MGVAVDHRVDAVADEPFGDRGRRDVGVVIVAGGSGSRVGGEELKQFRWVAGKPMLLHSVQAFMARPDVGMVVCVLPQQYAGDPPPWLFQCDVERLMVIKQMKPLGFSLEEMADILELFSSQETGSAGDAQDKLAAYLEKAVAERAKMARNLAQADQLIERLSGHG